MYTCFCGALLCMAVQVFFSFLFFFSFSIFVLRFHVIHTKLSSLSFFGLLTFYFRFPPTLDLLGLPQILYIDVFTFIHTLVLSSLH
jgi:hypothetical protein